MVIGVLCLLIFAFIISGVVKKKGGYAPITRFRCKQKNASINSVGLQCDLFVVSPLGMKYMRERYELHKYFIISLFYVYNIKNITQDPLKYLVDAYKKKKDPNYEFYGNIGTSIVLLELYNAQCFEQGNKYMKSLIYDETKQFNFAEILMKALGDQEKGKHVGFIQFVMEEFRELRDAMRKDQNIDDVKYIGQLVGGEPKARTRSPIITEFGNNSLDWKLFKLNYGVKNVRETTKTNELLKRIKRVREGLSDEEPPIQGGVVEEGEVKKEGKEVPRKRKKTPPKEKSHKPNPVDLEGGLLGGVINLIQPDKPHFINQGKSPSSCASCALYNLLYVKTNVSTFLEPEDILPEDPVKPTCEKVRGILNSFLSEKIEKESCKGYFYNSMNVLLLSDLTKVAERTKIFDKGRINALVELSFLSEEESNDAKKVHLHELMCRVHWISLRIVGNDLFIYDSLKKAPYILTDSGELRFCPINAMFLLNSDQINTLRKIFKGCIIPIHDNTKFDEINTSLTKYDPPPWLSPSVSSFPKQVNGVNMPPPQMTLGPPRVPSFRSTRTEETEEEYKLRCREKMKEIEEKLGNPGEFSADQIYTLFQENFEEGHSRTPHFQWSWDQSHGHFPCEFSIVGEGGIPLLEGKVKYSDKFSCKGSRLLGAMVAITEENIRNWYKLSEEECRKNFKFYEYSSEYEGKVSIFDHDRSDIPEITEFKESKIKCSKDLSEALVRNGIADIYPAEKVALFLIYSCFYDGLLLKDGFIKGLDTKLAAYLLYTFMFNTVCSCIMDKSWNSSLSNEYVYVYQNNTNRHNQNIMENCDQHVYDVFKLTVDSSKNKNLLSDATKRDPEFKKDLRTTACDTLNGFDKQLAKGIFERFARMEEVEPNPKYSSIGQDPSSNEFLGTSLPGKFEWEEGKPELLDESTSDDPGVNWGEGCVVSDWSGNHDNVQPQVYTQEQESMIEEVSAFQDAEEQFYGQTFEQLGQWKSNFAAAERIIKLSEIQDHDLENCMELDDFLRRTFEQLPGLGDVGGTYLKKATDLAQRVNELFSPNLRSRTVHIKSLFLTLQKLEYLVEEIEVEITKIEQSTVPKKLPEIIHNTIGRVAFRALLYERTTKNLNPRLDPQLPSLVEKYKSYEDFYLRIDDQNKKLQSEAKEDIKNGALDDLGSCTENKLYKRFVEDEYYRYGYCGDPLPNVKMLPSFTTSCESKYKEGVFRGVFGGTLSPFPSLKISDKVNVEEFGKNSELSFFYLEFFSSIHYIACEFPFECNDSESQDILHDVFAPTSHKEIRHVARYEYMSFGEPPLDTLISVQKHQNNRGQEKKPGLTFKPAFFMSFDKYPITNTLENILLSGDDTGCLSPLDTYLCIFTVLDGMADLHEALISHGDLNLFNIGKTINGEWLIWNHSLSPTRKLYQMEQDNYDTIFKDPMSKNTTEFRSDVFSFGIFLAIILRTTFSHENLNTCLRNLQAWAPTMFGSNSRNGNPKPFIEGTPADSYFNELIEKCLSLNPEDRPTFSNILEKLKADSGKDQTKTPVFKLYLSFTDGSLQKEINEQIPSNKLSMTLS